jgi:hypothetical protein
MVRPPPFVGGGLRPLGQKSCPVPAAAQRPGLALAAEGHRLRRCPRPRRLSPSWCGGSQRAEWFRLAPHVTGRAAGPANAYEEPPEPIARSAGDLSGTWGPWADVPQGISAPWRRGPASRAALPRRNRVPRDRAEGRGGPPTRGECHRMLPLRRGIAPRSRRSTAAREPFPASRGQCRERKVRRPATASSSRSAA